MATDLRESTLAPVVDDSIDNADLHVTEQDQSNVKEDNLMIAQPENYANQFPDFVADIARMPAGRVSAENHFLKLLPSLLEQPENLDKWIVVFENGEYFITPSHEDLDIGEQHSGLEFVARQICHEEL